MIRIILCVLLLLSTISIAEAQKVYVWKDQEGNLVFSDTPQGDAEEVELKHNPNNFAATDAASKSSGTTSDKSKPLTVSIVSPSSQETIRDNTGNVKVVGTISPRLPRGVKVQLYLDGSPYQAPQTSTLYQIKNLDRGEHTLRMDLIDKVGKVIAVSQSTTFFLHRASSLSPVNKG